MITRWRYFHNSVMITRWSYCLSAAIITRWHCYIDAVMITRCRYCINAAMITTWQYCISAAMVTRWHHCIGMEMVTGWVHWIVNVQNTLNCKKKSSTSPNSRERPPMLCFMKEDNSACYKILCRKCWNYRRRCCHLSWRTPLNCSFEWSTFHLHLGISCQCIWGWQHSHLQKLTLPQISFHLFWGSNHNSDDGYYGMTA